MSEVAKDTAPAKKEETTEKASAAVDETKANEEPENLRKIFAGGLNKATTDEEFKTHFEEFGKMNDCVIIKDPETKTSRGFGFVTYSSVAEADACIEKKKKEGGHELGGKNIEVKRAIPRELGYEGVQTEKSQRIYLGKVQEGITEENVKTYFQDEFNCVVENVELIREKKDENAEGDEPAKLRGFGFVSFDDFDAVDKIVITRNHKINGIHVFAKKAEPKGTGGGRGRGRGRGGFGGGRGYDNRSYGGGGYGYGQGGWGGYGGYGGGRGGYRGGRGGGYNRFNPY